MAEVEHKTEPDLHSAEAVTGSKPDDRVIRTEELFGDQTEIWIEHHGERYRLRITRRNKLILQK